MQNARFHRISVERDHTTASPSHDSITIRLDHLMEEPKDYKWRVPDAYPHLPYYTHELEPILGYSEAQLLSTSCGESVVRLRPDWENILLGIKRIGTVMVLTQNDNAISKNIGTYPINNCRENEFSTIGSQIQLRLNVNNWRMAFAVEENNEGTSLRSFQFFDEHGTAVHKVYLTKESNAKVYDDIVKINRKEDQTPLLHVEKSETTSSVNIPPPINISEFEQKWLKLSDVHDFQKFLTKYGIGRVQAYNLVKDQLACRVNNNGLNKILLLAAEKCVPLMFFVQNTGVVQIQSGLIEKVKLIGNWVNVIAHDFTVQINKKNIHSSWIVNKQTEDGIVTSFEIYDRNEKKIAMLYAKRDINRNIPSKWTTLLNSILPKSVREK